VVPNNSKYDCWQIKTVQDSTVECSAQLPFLAETLERGNVITFNVRYDTIRDAISTCARKPIRVSLVYRTEPTTKKCKTENLKSKDHRRTGHFWRGLDRFCPKNMGQRPKNEVQN